MTGSLRQDIEKSIKLCSAVDGIANQLLVVVVVDDFDTLVVVVDVNAFVVVDVNTSVVVDVNTFVVVLLFLTMLTTREDWEKSIKRCSVVNGPANQIIRHRDITTEGSRIFLRANIVSYWQRTT